MSVQKDKRRAGKLRLSVFARNHAKYVIQITKNQKIFKPEYNHEVTDDIVKEAKDINRYLWAANNIKVNSAERYNKRREYQEQAILICDMLQADIEIAQSIFHLSGRRVTYWEGLLLEIRNKAVAWMDNDAKRYEKYR